MKTPRCFLSGAIAAAAAVIAAAPARAQGVLTGDARLACEAILCLASGSRPDECTPSLRRYFGISYRRLNDTLRARANFLQLCPASEQTPEMQSLAGAIADGAGRCDAQSLNFTLLSWSGWDDARLYIGNRLPSYCLAYTGHAYTSASDLAPRYVGTPESGGYWVEARDHARAHAEHDARLAAERAAGRNGGPWGGP